jgi:hypothetical protein
VRTRAFIALAALAALMAGVAHAGAPLPAGSTLTVVRPEGALTLTAGASGVRVAHASGQAAHTGVAAEDLITVIDRVRVRAPEDLMAVLRAQPDKVHQLEILRAGKAISVWSHPATWRPFLTPTPPPSPAIPAPPPSPAVR